MLFDLPRAIQSLLLTETKSMQLFKPLHTPTFCLAIKAGPIFRAKSNLQL